MTSVIINETYLLVRRSKLKFSLLCQQQLDPVTSGNGYKCAQYNKKIKAELGFN